ncbi:MAG: antitoxin [Deltaproteobacteria bacterium]|nr:antitoxin [Deltaproteobacteria bacterium]
MARTTLDIDAPVLAALNRLQRAQGKTLGKLVSELVARALSEGQAPERRRPKRLAWKAQAMGARVDLEDREAVWAVLDEDPEAQR